MYLLVKIFNRALEALNQIRHTAFIKLKIVNIQLLPYKKNIPISVRMLLLSPKNRA